MSWKDNVLTACIAGVVGLATGALGSTLQYWSSDREQDIRLVEIGLGILRAPTTDDQIAPAREWAIRLVEANSGLQFNAEDRKRLLREAVNVDDFAGLAEALIAGKVLEGYTQQGPRIQSRP